MKRTTVLRHEFVEYIPETLQAGTIYISIAFRTAAHRCCCGCGQEVVTPLSPTDWTLIFDGDSVSLDPSIGNWSFQCQSHYWITRNRVEWAPRWSRKEIEAARADDRKAKARYFESNANASGGDTGHGKSGGSLRRRIRDWWA
ncbi:MAG: hypothetical protein HY682_10930 [Chloroflexi bacterium]|nr:hypothetical protein [Chloroflexota bacterium]